MTKPSDFFPRVVPMAALALALAGSGHAQTQDPGRSDGRSLIPYAASGYVGFNLGKPDWDTPCGAAGLACDDSSAAYHLYTGGMFNPWLGAEVGYIDFGRAERGGGRTRAHGLNLSLVGRVPLGESLSLHARLGTLYGRTETGVLPASGLVGGRDSGWEPSYGLGLGFHLSPRASIVLDWNRHRLQFRGVGRRDITTTSIGYVHRF